MYCLRQYLIKQRMGNNVIHNARKANIDLLQERFPRTNYFQIICCHLAINIMRFSIIFNTSPMEFSQFFFLTLYKIHEEGKDQNQLSQETLMSACHQFHTAFNNYWLGIRNTVHYRWHSVWFLWKYHGKFHEKTKVEAI